MQEIPVMEVSRPNRDIYFFAAHVVDILVFGAGALRCQTVNVPTRCVF